MCALAEAGERRRAAAMKRSAGSAAVPPHTACDHEENAEQGERRQAQVARDPAQLSRAQDTERAWTGQRTAAVVRGEVKTAQSRLRGSELSIVLLGRPRKYSTRLT